MADINTTLLGLNESVGMLESMGYFNFILPTGIFFLILYGILDRAKIVTEDKKINAVLALFISLFVMLYAYVNEVQWFFSDFYMKMAVAILVALFSMALSLFISNALVTNKVLPEKGGGIWKTSIAIMSVLIVGASFKGAVGSIGAWANDVSGIAISLVLLASIASAFSKKKPEGGGEA